MLLKKSFWTIAFLVFCFDSSDAQDLRSYYRLDSIVNADLESKPGRVVEDAKELVKVANQTGIDSLIFSALMTQAQVFNNLGMFDASQKAIYDLLPKYEKEKRYNFLQPLYFNLGQMSFQMQDHDKAMAYYIKSKKAAILARHFTDTIRINSEIGLEMIAAEKIREGIRLCQQSVELAKKNGDEEIIVYTLDNLSNSYAHIEDFEKSLIYQKEMLKYRFVEENLSNKTAIHQHLGEILIGLRRYDEAQPYVTKAIQFAKEMGSNDWLFDCYKNQSAIYEAKGNWKNALHYHKLYLETKDSVYRDDYANKMSAMSGYYELNEKNEAIRELGYKTHLAQEKIKQLYAWIVALISFIIAILFYINHRKNKREKELRQQFSKQQIQSIEDERQNIAKMLHDSVGQNILFIKNYIHKHGLNTPQLDQSIDQSLEEVRNISKDLYPNQLNQYGLGTAVEALCDKVRESTNVFVSSDIQLPGDQMVSKEIKINLYRIIQECISNSIKHAAATSIRITGEIVQGRFHLLVQDNGRGFDPEQLHNKAAKSFGLLNMQERARILSGIFKIESTPGHGTKNQIIVPI
jgi:signal transduction histidine kinase